MNTGEILADLTGCYTISNVFKEFCCCTVLVLCISVCGPVQDFSITGPRGLCALNIIVGTCMWLLLWWIYFRSYHY